MAGSGIQCDIAGEIRVAYVVWFVDTEPHSSYFSEGGFVAVERAVEFVLVFGFLNPVSLGGQAMMDMFGGLRYFEFILIPGVGF